MKTNGIYSEFSLATESATITCVWQRLKGWQGSEKAL